MDGHIDNETKMLQKIGQAKHAVMLNCCVSDDVALHARHEGWGV